MTVLLGTVDVNIREFRGNSRNFWVAYDLKPEPTGQGDNAAFRQLGIGQCELLLTNHHSYVGVRLRSAFQLDRNCTSRTRLERSLERVPADHVTWREQREQRGQILNSLDN